MLNKANITWSAKQIAGMVANGRITFDSIVQRSYVWENTRKSALIESIILGYPIPQTYAKKSVINPDAHATSKYSMLDGKQRFSTIHQFLTDQFKLTQLPPVRYMDEELGMECETDISGMLFSELPEIIQDIIKDTMFSIVYFDSLTDDEERELFKRLNNGKPLTTKQKLLASCMNINEMLELTDCAVLNDMLSEKAKENKEQVILAYKVFAMINYDLENTALNGAKLTSLIEKTAFTEDDKNRLSFLFECCSEVHDLLSESAGKKFYTETHFVSMVYFINKAIDEGISNEKIAEFIESFYGNIPQSYLDCSTNAVASKAMIAGRHMVIERAYNEFFDNPVELTA